MRRRPIAVLILLAVLSTLAAVAFAASAIPLTATFQSNESTTGFGVSDDGNATYANGVGGVQCYFGVNRSDVVLVTYNTPRKLHFVFDRNTTAFKNSGLPSSDFFATVDVFGVNYYGAFPSMKVGTTAQVQLEIEFYVGSLTYQLLYQSVAAMRTSSTTWLITTDPDDIPGFPGFTASNQAALSVIRRHSQTTFGAVNMPVRFEVTE